MLKADIVIFCVSASLFLPALTRRPFRTCYAHMCDMHMEPFGEDILGREDRDCGLDDKDELQVVRLPGGGS